MQPLLFFRLSFMMFLEYFVPGFILPILSLYLKDYLGFSPLQVGLVLAMPALVHFVVPYITANVADRYISAERLLAILQLSAGVAMLVLSRQTQFMPFLIVYALYGLLFVPSFGLTNTIVLHHVPSARRYFGIIRGLGTVGWVVVAWAFGYFWVRGGGDSGSRLPDALVWCGWSAIGYGLYSLTLPRSGVQADRGKTFTYWEAIRVFARPGLLILCGLTFLNSMVHQSYYYGISHFMRHVGFPDQQIMPAMSSGQICEVGVMAALGYLLYRLGVKRTLLVGAVAQLVRCLIFAYSTSFWLILFGLALHGICYACFFTAAYIYVDDHSTPKTRAGVQQLYTVAIGAGNLAGFIVAGIVRQAVTNPETSVMNYHHFWLFPAGISLAVVAGTLVLFREEATSPQPTHGATAP